MFTGIIEELGEVKRIERRSGSVSLEISAKLTIEDTKVGDSISVNGACLTVTDIDKNSFKFDIVSETLKKSSLGDLRLRNKVNLERSLKLSDRLSGHMVSGHIDCVGIIRAKRQLANEVVFTIAMPESFTKQIVSKGSIAIDGISLTIANIRGNVFDVHIIPHTLKNTSLGNKGPSSKVNIELDMIGKYARNISR